MLIEQDPLANFHSLATNPYVVQFSATFGFSVLPQHAHEVLIFTAYYVVLFYGTAIFAPLIMSEYRQLSPSKKHGFDAHVVSSFNAVTMCVLSFPMFFSTSLNSLSSYTPWSGLVVAHNISYFLWDIYVTIVYYKYNGRSYFLHALTALYTFLQAMRPFMMNFAAPFIWFEASTPFVNINWFGTHVPGLVSPGLRQLNGLVLLVVFFLCRIVSGPYNGYLLFKEALVSPPPYVPYSAVVGVLASYLTLVSLNFSWFYKMLKIAYNTLKKSKTKSVGEPVVDPVVVSSSGVVEETRTTRRRRV